MYVEAILKCNCSIIIIALTNFVIIMLLCTSAFGTLLKGGWECDSEEEVGGTTL